MYALKISQATHSILSERKIKKRRNFKPHDFFFSRRGLWIEDSFTQEVLGNLPQSVSSKEFACREIGIKASHDFPLSLNDLERLLPSTCDLETAAIIVYDMLIYEQFKKDEHVEYLLIIKDKNGPEIEGVIVITYAKDLKKFLVGFDYNYFSQIIQSQDELNKIKFLTRYG